MEEIVQKIKKSSLIIIGVLVLIIILLGILLVIEDQQLAQAEKKSVLTSYQPTCRAQSNNQPTIITESTAICHAEFIVTASNYKFTPDHITVHKGDRVKIIL